MRVVPDTARDLRAGARVGFLGPGRMGAPMVERLVAAGHEVRVLARREEVAERLRSCGAAPVPTAAEAARSADVVLVCLFSDEQLQQVLGGPAGLVAGLERGAVVASHVTGRRGTLRELAARLEGRGVEVVDAPVSGGEREIRAGALTVLLGGADRAVERVGAVVRAYADPVLPTGPLGSALAVKLVNNLLFAAHAQAALAAVALGEQLGAPPGLLLSALQEASGRSFAVDVVARAQGAVPGLEATVGEFLRKDVAACLGELEAAGADAGLLGQLIAHGALDLVPRAGVPAAATGDAA